MSKYRRFKPGDKVHVKSLEQIKNEFKLYFVSSTGNEHYLGEYDLYFSTHHHALLCGKEVTIDWGHADQMTEDEDQYDFFLNMYQIVENPVIDGVPHSAMWSAEMFIEGRED